ncbi:MAG: hypothetical protein K1X81_08390 [Bacteroidia bacterium]|nr:hypothetical protein [Bacteroidia bacterium]
MKTYHQLLLLFTALLTMNLHCEKDRPEDNKLPAVLPPATTIGANTFGCEINGIVWNATEINADYWNGDFLIGASQKAPFTKTQTLIIQVLDHIHDTGYYELTYHDTDTLDQQVYVIHSGDSKKYKNPSGEPVKIKITRLDSIQRIISGRFDFDLKAEGSGEMIYVHNGRFDVKY